MLVGESVGKPILTVPLAGFSPASDTIRRMCFTELAFRQPVPVPITALYVKPRNAAACGQPQ